MIAEIKGKVNRGGIQMPRKIAIGEQDFGKIVEKNCFYVDKTSFIKEWWENEDTVTLLTRPRRFGKTLMMNTLYYFFSVDHAGRGDLFQRLAVWKEEKFRKIQGTYPVVFLSFADVKADCYLSAREGMIQELTDVYNQFAFIMQSDRLTQQDREAFAKVNEDMSDMTAARALKRLSSLLYKYYGKKAIILLDEYDTPMQEAYVNGYWGQLTEFMRSLLNSTFKSNLYLERGIMTGITRVSKESVFSDLNHLTVVTTTSRMYETCFGFTEEEVVAALEEFSMQDQLADVKRWYDGFLFGRSDNIYNPWSITNFLKFGELTAYWTNTSSNRLVGSLIQKGSAKLKTVMEDLLHGNIFHTVLDEQVVFGQLDDNESAVWSLLLASGYLKTADYKLNQKGKKEYALKIVNFEVLRMFEDLIANWFSSCCAAYNDFIKAVLANDVKTMNAYMNQITVSIISHFDSGKKPSDKTEPERFFHGLVLGLMAELGDKYTISSNRESGFGRYDVLFEPRSDMDDGIIFEFKVFDAEEEAGLADTVRKAIEQVIDKKYAAVLESKGVAKSKIRIYGFAFQGKNVQIDGGYIQELERKRSSRD